MKQQVAVIGEGVIDRFIEPSGHRDVIGGSPLNTAVALHRAGIDTHWWARISDSAEGQSILEYAINNQVAGPGVAVLPQPAPIVSISLDSQGVPTYEFALDLAADWSWDTADFSDLSDYAAVQIGSLTAVLEPGSTAILHALQELQKQSVRPIISFDPNARPRAAKDEADAERMRTVIAQFVGLADLIKVSDEDLEWFDASTNPATIAANWSTQGPQLVVMTRGANGAAAFVDGELIAETPGIKVEVIDTVGAGDTFMAWLLAFVVMAGEIPAHHHTIQPAIERAAAAAAITCSRKGCNPPNLSDF